MIEEDSEIVFGTPDAPSEELEIEEAEEKKPKKQRPRCNNRDSVTLGYIWLCLRPKYHKGRCLYTRVPRDHGLPHPERKETNRLFD